jgi:hypothetical protein
MTLLNQKTKQRNILPLFTVATFALNILILFLLIFHSSMLRQISGKQPESLVQLADGRTVTVNSQEYLERHPETIRRFVGETLTLMFTWSQKQPPETVWQIGSDLLSNAFQQKFISDITQIIPLKNTSIVNTESVFVLRRISQPEEIAPGKWKVQVIAHYLIFTSSDQNGQFVPFNKQILIQTTEGSGISLPDSPVPLNFAVSRLGEAKLEIYNVCDIKDKKCI